MSDTYQLQYPITLTHKVQGAEPREEVIDEVTVRSLKAKDLREVDKHEGKMAQNLALIGALTGLPPAAVDKLDLADVVGLSELISSFFL